MGKSSITEPRHKCSFCGYSAYYDFTLESHQKLNKYFVCLATNDDHESFDFCHEPEPLCSETKESAASQWVDKIETECCDGHPVGQGREAVEVIVWTQNDFEELTERLGDELPDDFDWGLQEGARFIVSGEVMAHYYAKEVTS